MSWKGACNRRGGDRGAPLRRDGAVLPAGAAELRGDAGAGGPVEVGNHRRDGEHVGSGAGRFRLRSAFLDRRVQEQCAAAARKTFNVPGAEG
jgi:hypothetical protein